MSDGARVDAALEAYVRLYQVLVVAAGSPDLPGVESAVASAARSANRAFAAAGLDRLPAVVTGPTMRRVYPGA
ncbi:hypothetical protein ACWGII_43470 [Streptomyces sp. NPDC054855]